VINKTIVNNYKEANKEALKVDILNGNKFGEIDGEIETIKKWCDEIISMKDKSLDEMTEEEKIRKYFFEYVK
jgi:hypothetical protein